MSYGDFGASLQEGIIKTWKTWDSDKLVQKKAGTILENMNKTELWLTNHEWN